MSVEPLVGYRKTTNFIFTCNGFTDDSNKTEFETRFYSIEANTGGLVNTIKNLSLVTTAEWVFDVKYFNLPKTILTIYCEVLDNFQASKLLKQDVYIFYNDNRLQ